MKVLAGVICFAVIASMGFWVMHHIDRYLITTDAKGHKKHHDHEDCGM